MINGILFNGSSNFRNKRIYNTTSYGIIPVKVKNNIKPTILTWEQWQAMNVDFSMLTPVGKTISQEEFTKEKERKRHINR